MGVNRRASQQGTIAMPDLTITIPTEQAEFAARRATELGLSSPGELVSRLLDQESRRRDERERMESLLLEGQAAEPGDLISEAWWDRFDTEVFGQPLRETGQ